MSKIQTLLRQPRVVAALAVLAATAILFIPAVRSTLLKADGDLLLGLRPQRGLSDRYVLISIGQEDIQALGGWPLSRDYYGYLIHGLTRMGARVVAMDLLLDSASPAHPERDRLLAEFMETAPPVVLPFVYGKLDREGAGDPIWPLPVFGRFSSQGFSNLDEGSRARALPLAVPNPDSLTLSLGAEMARRALGSTVTARLNGDRLLFTDGQQVVCRVPLVSGNRLQVNPIGGLDRIHQMGLVEALRRIADDPEDPAWKDCLVMVAVTAPGLPVLARGADGRLLPAGALHLLVAENILDHRWLTVPPIWVSLLWLLALPAILLFLWDRWPSKRRWLAWGLALVFSGSAGFVVLTVWNVLAPVTASWLVLLVMTLVLGTMESQRLRRRGLARTEAFKKRLAQEREALDAARSQLAELTDRHATVSEDQAQALSQAQERVLVLEKRLRDLESYDQPAQAIQRQYGGLVHGKNSPLQTVLDLVETVASGGLPVIIQGETGTGKELVARAVHRSSARRQAPFVAVNCGALSEGLLESELFGHEKGAFTGAHARRKGRFELAHGGTLFLDEITETHPAFQARLLRVLQEGTFERVGGEQTLKTDVQIIAATNRDLKEEVAQNRFRADLYYRLNGVTLSLPPLRERPGDLPVLVQHFLKIHGAAPVEGVSAAAMERLQSHAWPGNVRELENAVRRAAVMAKGQGRSLIQESDLPDELLEAPVQPPPGFMALEDQILESLRRFAFSRSAISQTAKALGDRDRGTITEYLRGLCFEALEASGFDKDRAAMLLAGEGDAEAIDRVAAKMDGYLENLGKALAESDAALPLAERMASSFRGLPKRYHGALEAVIQFLKRGEA